MILSMYLISTRDECFIYPGDKQGCMHGLIDILLVCQVHVMNVSNKYAKNEWLITPTSAYAYAERMAHMLILFHKLGQIYYLPLYMYDCMSGFESVLSGIRKKLLNYCETQWIDLIYNYHRNIEKSYK